MSQVIKIHPMEDFKERSRGVLNDPAQRKNFRGAMDFLQAKRRSQFPDQDELQGLRELLEVQLGFHRFAEQDGGKRAGHRSRRCSGQGHRSAERSEPQRFRTHEFRA